LVGVGFPADTSVDGVTASVGLTPPCRVAVSESGSVVHVDERRADPERGNEIRRLNALIVNEEILPHENLLWS
jgi:hypothetical protein